MREGEGRGDSGREICWNWSSDRCAFEASAEKKFYHTCGVHVGDYQHCLMYFLTDVPQYEDVNAIIPASCRWREVSLEVPDIHQRGPAGDGDCSKAV